MKKLRDHKHEDKTGLHYPEMRRWGLNTITTRSCFADIQDRTLFLPRRAFQIQRKEQDRTQPGNFLYKKKKRRAVELLSGKPDFYRFSCNPMSSKIQRVKEESNELKSQLFESES